MSSYRPFFLETLDERSDQLLIGPPQFGFVEKMNKLHVLFAQFKLSIIDPAANLGLCEVYASFLPGIFIISETIARHIVRIPVPRLEGRMAAQKMNIAEELSGD